MTAFSYDLVDFNPKEDDAAMPDRKRLEFLIKAVEKSPEADFPRYALAMEFVSLEEFDAAEEQFTTLLGKHPQHVPGHFMLAKFFEQVNRIEDARKTLEKGIQIAEEVGDTHAKEEMEEELEQLD